MIAKLATLPLEAGTSFLIVLFEAGIPVKAQAKTMLHRARSAIVALEMLVLDHENLEADPCEVP